MLSTCLTCFINCEKHACFSVFYYWTCFIIFITGFRVHGSWQYNVISSFTGSSKVYPPYLPTTAVGRARAASDDAHLFVFNRCSTGLGCGHCARPSFLPYHFAPVLFRLCYCSINCLFINILNFPNWQAVKRQPFGYLYLSTTALTLASLAVYLQIIYSNLSSAIWQITFVNLWSESSTIIVACE